MTTIRLEFPSFSASYCRLDPIADGDEPSLSAPFAIDLSFSGHPAAVVEHAPARRTPRRVARNTGGMTSGDPARWVVVPEPAECVEFRPAAALRRAVCDELRVPAAAEFAEFHGVEDPVLWSAGARVRAAATGGWPLQDIEADALVHGLVRHMVGRFLGGRRPRATDRRLDAARLKRVCDYVDACLDGELTLERLADVAALSRFHFIRAFRATTGSSPHGFVVARRMERARDLVVGTGLPVSEVARRVGYTNGHHFRRTFERHFGCRPAALRRP